MAHWCGPLPICPAKGVKLAIAQEEVPAGRYAREVIQQLAADSSLGPEYADRFLANVVTDEPNVRNVLQKVALGEVDAGFVYYSDARVAPDVSVIPKSPTRPALRPSTPSPFSIAPTRPRLRKTSSAMSCPMQGRTFCAAMDLRRRPRQVRHS